MATFLFAWNPRKWDWTDLEQIVEQVRRSHGVSSRWSCSRKRDLPKGSPFLLIRLGVKPAGIIGWGETTKPPYPGEHWDGSGRKTNFVDILFRDLRAEPLITWGELRKPPFSRFRWGIQSSGVRIPEDLAMQLHELWLQRAGLITPPLPEELPVGERFVEGTRKTISVNAYERDPLARSRCLEHYGFRCAVCDVLLAERYGDIARELIHVHHLVKISRAGKSYEVDPVRDLRPVCPNCHAILHRKDPPLSIGAAKSLLRKI